jgi:hypothetical protein
MPILDLAQLARVTGGQAAEQEPQRDSADFRDHDDMRDFERRHPLTSLICQGDYSCLRDARRR